MNSDTATAIEQLYHDYSQPILRYLERMVGQHEAAEDLCQETFLKALRSWEQHESNASVRGWLYRIATNTAYDYLRRRQRIAMTSLSDDYSNTLSGPRLEQQRDDAEPIWAALHHIPYHYRTPLLLQMWVGYSLTDIATILGCNVNTVKTRVYRARAHFRQHYIA